MRYGTARIAIKLSSVREKGIYFNQCYGGGTAHCHGEDTIFLSECLKKGLRIIAVPVYIASLADSRPSTWERGYNEKYIHDQGSLYRTMSRRWWLCLCLQDAIRHHKKYNMSIARALRIMVSH